MVTVFRAHGLRFVIFTDDHDPAHVHVFGDGEAKINLVATDEAPELVWTVGLTRAELRKAMRVVKEHRELFLECWSAIHDCSN